MTKMCIRDRLFKTGEKEPVILPKNSSAFFLIQRIRDEAHRFALSYHKKLRNREIRDSMIDFIPGIGEKRKRQLLTKFKSIESIKNASIEELKEIPGIGEKTAKKIRDILEVRHDCKVQR